MPEAVFDTFCRGQSLRDIINYNCACPGDCSCTVPKHKNRRRHRRRKAKPELDKSCPQRIEQISRPLNRVLLHTLEHHSNVFDSERVSNICRLIHELEYPQPKPVNFLKKLRHVRRCKRRKLPCKSKKSCEKWLNAQACRSADICIKYLKYSRKIVPNFKQLQVTMMLYKYLNFRKVRTDNRFVKEELKTLCQKLAILMDTKLEPYKRELVIETVSVSTLEDKHCVFKMFEIESEVEEVEEEEESLVSSLFEMKSISIMEEELGMEFEGISELVREVEEEEAGIEGLAEGELEEYMLEPEEQIMEEILSMEQAGIMGEEVAASMEEELALAAEEIEGGLVEEALGIAEAESIFEKLVEYEESLAIAGEEAIPEVPVAFEEEEESVMEAVSEEEMLDYHLDGTSSYVDWCLYVSWLRELGTNIEMYAGCLQSFRKALSSRNPSKYAETLRYLLKNWTNYLSDSRKVDNNMTQYFKDKPMTWCSNCRDCTIDDYPSSHYIPPELAETIKVTKQWRRLLAEAEEYCQAICAGPKEEEEGEMELEEVYEIYDVGSSSTSSFEVEALSQTEERKKKK